MRKVLRSNRELVRRSETEWKTILRQYHQSGLSQKQFCQRESIGLSTFQKWKKALEGRLSHADFIEVDCSPETTSPWDVELDLGFGITLRLRQG